MVIKYGFQINVSHWCPGLEFKHSSISDHLVAPFQAIIY